MNGVGFEILARTPVPQLPPSYPTSNLGYRNGTILAILNLCVTVMPPVKFQLNRTYDLGRAVV